MNARKFTSFTRTYSGDICLLDGDRNILEQYDLHEMHYDERETPYENVKIPIDKVKQDVLFLQDIDSAFISIQFKGKNESLSRRVYRRNSVGQYVLFNVLHKDKYGDYHTRWGQVVNSLRVNDEQFLFISASVLLIALTCCAATWNLAQESYEFTRFSNTKYLDKIDYYYWDAKYIYLFLMLVFITLFFVVTFCWDQFPKKWLMWVKLPLWIVLLFAIFIFPVWIFMFLGEVFFDVYW